jgi:hypothetical protein
MDVTVIERPLDPKDRAELYAWGTNKPYGAGEHDVV